MNIAIVLISVIALSGCAVRRVTSESNDSSETPPAPGPALPTSTDIELQEFASCYSTPVVAATLSNCLEAKSAVPTSEVTAFRQAVDVCAAAGEAGNSTFLAICLETKSFVVRNRRLPFQSDFEACATKAGPTKIATCLDKKGLLPSTLAQSNIDTCLAQSGNVIGGLEKCLRVSGNLPKKSLLSQFEVSLCSKVSGPTKIHSCLLNNDLITLTNGTPSILLADIDACIASSQVSGVVGCLRTGLKIRRNVTQSHIDSCREVVGAKGIVSCLNANGILLMAAGTALAQADVDTCVAAVGENSIASCLRNKGFLNKVLSQADIADCSQYVGSTGTDIQRCLFQNGLLPTGVTATQIDACSATVAATPGLTVAKCLRNQNFLSKAVMQADINLCNRLVDGPRIAGCLNSNFTFDTAVTQGQVDTCLNNAAVGLANTSKCLKNQAVVAQVLLQPHFTSCLANAGTTGIAACLNTNGFVDAAPVTPLVPITQTMIDTCISNVGTANLSRCVALQGGVTRTLSQAHFSSCNTFAGPTGIVACLTANNLDVPATVTQAAVDTCIANVGVANIVTCLTNGGLIPPPIM